MLILIPNEKNIFKKIEFYSDWLLKKSILLRKINNLIVISFKKCFKKSIFFFIKLEKINLCFCLNFGLRGGNKGGGKGIWPCQSFSSKEKIF